MNNTMNTLCLELKKKQSEDIEQIAKYKALTTELEDKVRERELTIGLLESGNNPEHRNKTLGQVLNY